MRWVYIHRNRIINMNQLISWWYGFWKKDCFSTEECLKEFVKSRIYCIHMICRAESMGKLSNKLAGESEYTASIDSSTLPTCPQPLSFKSCHHVKKAYEIFFTDYWAMRSSVRSFARTTHPFACSTLLASVARSAAPTRSIARSLPS